MVADSRERDLHLVNSNAFNQDLLTNVEPVLLLDYFPAVQILSRVIERS